MNFFENLRTALVAIAANKLRGLLTMLGVIIGVYAVATMMALGQMATNTVTQQLNQIGGSQLYIYPADVAGRQTTRDFTNDDLTALGSLPVSDITAIRADMQATTPLKNGNLSLSGVRANYLSLLPNMRLRAGRFINDSEIESSAPVIVLNQFAAKRYFGKENPLGKSIRMSQTVQGKDGQPRPPRREELTVIGVVESPSGMFSSDQEMGYLPMTYAQRNFAKRDSFATLKLKVQEGANLQQVKQRVTDILISRRGEQDFEVENFDQFVSEYKQITGVLQLSLSAIGSLSLLVGGIGIMNIMLVSVTERTREIGLRKAVGAKRGTILTQFLIEATTLTGLGGVVGYVLSVLTIFGVTIFTPQFFPTMTLSPSVAVLALGVSVGIGLLFGVWPANRASQLTPIEALRYE